MIGFPSDDGTPYNRNLYSVEAEMSVLGSIMLYDNLRYQRRIIDRIKPSIFNKHAHQMIFEAMVDVIRKDQVIEYLTLKDALVANGNLQNIGGSDYIIQCAQYVPSAANLVYYLEIVEEKAARRLIVARCKKLIEFASKGNKLADIQEKINLLGKGISVHDVPLRAINPADLEGDITGVLTGYPTIDRATGVGYIAGQTTVVSAYTKGGKSAWMAYSAVAAAMAEKRVVYATFADLNRSQLSRRLMRSATGWGKMPGNQTLAQAWSETLFDFSNEVHPLYIYDASELKDSSIEGFALWITEHHEKRPIDILFLDYGQKIRTRVKGMSQYERDTHVADEVQRLATELNIPIVVGSQITEGGKDRKDTTKGTRTWEENGGLIIRLGRDKDRPATHRTVEIPLSRFCEESPVLTWAWDPEKLRFIDPAL